MDITDAQVFSVLKEKLRPAILTQAMVDVTNIAMETVEGRAKILALLNLKATTTVAEKRLYNLTVDILKKVYPNINPAVVPIILKYAPEYGIVTKKQMCAFLANCIVESKGFNAKRESFAYSAKRLVEVFSSKRIPNLAFATKLVSKGQMAIANHLYGGRYGNRPNTNDGWDYRGGGVIQNTFRSNYYELQNVTGIAFGDNPKLIEVLDNAVVAAMTYWKLHNISELAEYINVYKDGYTLNTLNAAGHETKDYKLNTGIRLVRKAINGGFIGLDEVAENFEKCMRYL